MVYNVTYPWPTIISIKDQLIEQVAHFNYLGCGVSYKMSRQYVTYADNISICGRQYADRSFEEKTRVDTTL